MKDANPVGQAQKAKRERVRGGETKINCADL